MRVLILRGVPGAGKTTYLKTYSENYVVCSADDHFIVDGKYEFRPELLPEAHAACLRKFIRLIADRYETPGLNIAIDNTNLTIAEIAPYAAIALAYGCELEILTLKTDPMIAAPRNVHGVDEKTVEQMYKRMNAEALRFPPWWRHRQEYPPKMAA